MQVNCVTSFLLTYNTILKVYYNNLPFCHLLAVEQHPAKRPTLQVGFPCIQIGECTLHSVKGVFLWQLIHRKSKPIRQVVHLAGNLPQTYTHAYN